MLTVIFHNSCPDWSDPKMVCPYHSCRSRNRPRKSTMPPWAPYCSTTLGVWLKLEPVFRQILFLFWMTRIDFIYRGRGAKCNEKWSILHIFFRAWNWYRITTWKTHFQLNFRIFWTEVGLNIETNVVYTTPMVFSLNSVGTLKLTMDTKCGHIVKSTLFRTSKWRFLSHGFFFYRADFEKFM